MLPAVLHNPSFWNAAAVAGLAVATVRPWMAHAGLELGVAEKPGPDSNPRVVMYLKSCGYTDKEPDSTDWCGAFVNWVLKQAGIEGAFHPQGAAWWKAWGDVLPNDDPPFGAVGIFQRSATNCHVGFLLGQIDNRKGQEKFLLLGGNQEAPGANSPQVCVKVEGRKLVGIRYPPSKK